MNLLQTKWQRRIIGFALFGLPILLFTVVLFYGSGEKTRYEVSWMLLQHTLNFLCPEHTPPGDPNAIRVDFSMYQINGALRRVAHIVAYAVLSCLVVRCCQAGAPRLKRRSLIAAVVVSVLYTGGDELHRALEPNRHVHFFDLGLNLAGTFLVLSGTLLFFWLKHWERAWAEAEAAQTGETTPGVENQGSNKPD